MAANHCRQNTIQGQGPKYHLSFKNFQVHNTSLDYSLNSDNIQPFTNRNLKLSILSSNSLISVIPKKKTNKKTLQNKTPTSYSFPILFNDNPLFLVARSRKTWSIPWFLVLSYLTPDQSHHQTPLVLPSK